MENFVQSIVSWNGKKSLKFWQSGRHKNTGMAPDSKASVILWKTLLKSGLISAPKIIRAKFDFSNNCFLDSKVPQRRFNEFFSTDFLQWKSITTLSLVLSSLIKLRGSSIMVFMAMFSDKLGSWYDTRYFRLTGNNDGNFDHKSEGLSKYLNQNLWFWPKTQVCSNAK